MDIIFSLAFKRGLCIKQLSITGVIRGSDYKLLTDIRFSDNHQLKHVIPKRLNYCADRLRSRLQC